MARESIEYNIQLMVETGLKIDGVLDTASVKKEICHNNQYLSILLIKGDSSDHAVFLFKKNDIVSIIDPLGTKSGFSSSLEEIKNDLINSGTKFVNIIYSDLQQIDSGTCADISLILIKNILDKIQNIQSIEDILEIIESIRAGYNSTELEKQVKSLDSRVTSEIDIVTEINNSFQKEEKNQSACYYNNKLTLQQDNIDTYLLELIGLILLRTIIGNLYLAKCEAVETQSDNPSTLPTIMAQCLHQSTMMKELVSIQSLQRRFFAALTVFASLKHKGICFEEKFSCCATEIPLSKKILLDLNIHSLKQLNLDPDLWSIAFSAHSYFCENYKVVSKTVPYSTDHPSLFIELDESDLQSSSASALPLLVEIGLVLSIPHEWKGLDCFKLVKKSLPIYIRIQTLVVHEFYFIKKSTNVATINHSWNSPRSILQIINDVAKGKPISNLLKSNIDILTDLPSKFQFCFPISSIQEILEKNQEPDPCHFVLKILLKKSVRNFSQDNESLSYRNKPVTITVEKIESTILITLISKDLDLLLGMRMATLELLLSHQLSCEINPQTYVSIPGNIVRLCEELSKKIDNYGKYIDSEEHCRNIIMLYTELRQNISNKLPVL